MERHPRRPRLGCIQGVFSPGQPRTPDSRVLGCDTMEGALQALISFLCLSECCFMLKKYYKFNYFNINLSMANCMLMIIFRNHLLLFIFQKKKVGDCWDKAIHTMSYCYISFVTLVAAHCPNFPASHFLIFTSCFQALAMQKPSIICAGSCAEVS